MSSNAKELELHCSVSSPWEPLLTSPSQVNSIKVYLKNFTKRLLLGSSGDSDSSLASGLMGKSFFLAYQTIATDQNGDTWPAELGTPKEKCIELLNLAVEKASEGSLSYGLYGGFAGIGWATQHIQNIFQMKNQEGDTCEVVDQLLIDLLGRPNFFMDYELVGGLAGIALYALERLPHNNSNLLLDLVLKRIVSLSSEPYPGEISWHTPGNRVPVYPRTEPDEYSNGIYNLGIAHGIPGLMGILCRMKAEWADHLSNTTISTQLEALIGSATRWFEKIIRGFKLGTPNFLYEGGLSVIRPPSWCYGDLGIAATATMMKHSVGSVQIENFADYIALKSERQSQILKAPSTDLGLCHGTASSAHLFSRMYNYLRQPRYKEAALSALQTTLSVLETSQWQMPQPIPPASSWNFGGFLEGETGLALVLLSAILPIEPSWDRLLVASDIAQHKNGTVKEIS